MYKFILCHTWFLFVFHLTLGSGFTFPGCCTSESHWDTRLLSYLPSTSHCINPVGWHHAYWESITAHSFPCINCIPKCFWHSSWTFWSLKMGLIGCPKTLVQNYYSTLCKFLKDCRSHLHHSWSLKSCVTLLCLVYLFEKCYSIFSCMFGCWFSFIHDNNTIFMFLLYFSACISVYSWTVSRMGRNLLTF